MNNKVFSKKNVIFAIISILFISVSYYLNYKISNYPKTVNSPILMLLGYLPIAFIEKDILGKINNNILKVIIKCHIVFTLFMITAYLMTILYLMFFGDV